MKRFLFVLIVFGVLSTSRAQYFELTFADTAGTIDPVSHNLILIGHLKNITTTPLHIKMVRLQNNLPDSTWSSSMCLDIACFPPGLDSATTMLPNFSAISPGDSIVVDIIFFHVGSVPGTATALVKYATMDDSQVELQWFEANSLLTSIENAPDFVGTDFTLFNNYPNPFNNQTVISAMIDSPGKVTLQIFDILGREVYILSNNTFSPGLITFRWDGVNNNGTVLSSGIYFYRITINQNGNIKKSQTKKLTLLR